MMESAPLSLDTSQWAAQNEDLPGESWGNSRLGFQRSLLPCLSGACLAGGRLCGSATSSAAVQPQHTAEVALIASHSGKAGVVLPPSGRAELLLALESLPTGGDCNPVAAVKLALLLARRFSSIHITAFIASPCQVSPAVATDLQQRLAAAEGVSLDLVVLAHPEELGEAALAGLALLTEEHGLEQPAAETVRLSAGEAGTAITAAAAAEATRPAGLAAAVASPAPAAAARCRVVWVPPKDMPQGVEDWQQLEFVLEKLEGRGSNADDDWAAAVAEIDVAAAEEEDATEGQHGTGWGHSSSLPRGVVTGSMSGRSPFARNRASNSSSRGTNAQRPRAPLLALRSGLHQPARCRGESLDRLGHLSVDGMMRPWLPTYSSLGAKAQQQAQQQGAGMQLVAGRGAAAAREQCYLQVCPIPKWRTLLKIAAGLMKRCDEAAVSQSAAAAAARSGVEAAAHATRERQQLAADAGSSCSRKCFASLSSALLRGLASLRLPGEESAHSLSELGEGRAGDSSSASGPGSSAAGHPPVRLVPDERRGTLRLLQAVKEPDLLKLVWQPDESPRTPQAASGSIAPASAAAAATAAAAPVSELQPFNMFSVPGACSPAAESAAPLDPLAPTQAVAAAQPLTHQGIEYWEGGVSWELELLLRAEEGPGAADPAIAGVAADGAGESVSGRQLPNDAQLLLVRASACGARSIGWGSGGSSHAFGCVWDAGQQVAACMGHHRDPHAFWLQQRWDPAQCLSPAATPVVAGISASRGTPAGRAQGPKLAACPAAADKPWVCAGQSGADAAMEAGQEASAAAAVAAAVAGLLAAPPPVDVRQLRRDVKDGSIKVTPVTVGPLPARLVHDLVSARASIMSSMGVENLDDSVDGPGSGSCGRQTGGSEKGRGREEPGGVPAPAACGRHAQDGDGPGEVACGSVAKRRRAAAESEAAGAAALQGNLCQADTQLAFLREQQHQLHAGGRQGGPELAARELGPLDALQPAYPSVFARSEAAAATPAPIPAAAACASATADSSSAPGTPGSAFGTPLQVVSGAPGCAFAGAYYAKEQGREEGVPGGTRNGGALGAGVEAAGGESGVGVVAAEQESRDDSMVFKLD